MYSWNRIRRFQNIGHFIFCRPLLTIRNNAFDPYLVLASDLFQGSPQLNTHRVLTPFAEDQRKFQRSEQDDDVLLDSANLKLYEISDIIKLLSPTSNMADIEDRVRPIETFIGDAFPLLVEEKIAVVCGLMNFQLPIYPESELHDEGLSPLSFHGRSLGYSTARLRVFGKQLFLSSWLRNTTFDNERYLSMLQQEIMFDIHQFASTTELIVEFMKRLALYQVIQPYRGAMKYGRIDDYDEYLNAKEKILETTSEGSFYTLMGICWVKFGRQKTATGLVEKKIIHGSNGLIRLITEHRAKNRG